MCWEPQQGSGLRVGAQNMHPHFSWVPPPTDWLMPFAKTPVTCFTAFMSLLKPKWWMLLLRVIKAKLYIYPTGIRYNSIMFFPLIGFFFPLSSWTLLTSLWVTLSFHCRFIKSPVASEQFPANQWCWWPWVCMEVVIAVQIGQGWDSVFQREDPTASMNHLEKTLVNKPLSHCNLHLIRCCLFCLTSVNGSQKVKTTPGNGWVFVQREVNPNVLFNSIHLSRCQLLWSFLGRPRSLKLCSHSLCLWSWQCAWEHSPWSASSHLCYSPQRDILFPFPTRYFLNTRQTP